MSFFVWIAKLPNDQAISRTKWLGWTHKQILLTCEANAHHTDINKMVEWSTFLTKYSRDWDTYKKELSEYSKEIRSLKKYPLVSTAKEIKIFPVQSEFRVLSKSHTN